MIRELTAGLLTLILAIGIEATASETQPHTPWNTGGRLVPAPSAASEALRRAIAETPTPNVEVARNNYPAADDEWLAAQAKTDSGWTATALNLAKKLDVAVDLEEIGGVPVRRMVPAKVDPRHKSHLFIHVHGGAYVFGSGDAGTSEAIVIAHEAGIPVLSIDYRMPPVHPFPAAVNDVAGVYRVLLKSNRAKSLAIGGTSAGGGLALAATHKFIEMGLEVPGAIFAGTPWADLSKTGDSQFTNEGLDRVLVTYDGLLRAAAILYANGHSLRDPLISPVYGNFQGFPPTYLVTGTRDLFLSDTARTHRRLRTSGVIADLNVYEGMSHGEYILVPDTPEYQQTFEDLNAFLLEHLE